MPVRARDLIRALGAFGVEVSPSRGGSSHWIAEKDGIRYSLPMKRGPTTELKDVYVRGACRAFGLDEPALRRKL